MWTLIFKILFYQQVKCLTFPLQEGLTSFLMKIVMTVKP